MAVSVPSRTGSWKRAPERPELQTKRCQSRDSEQFFSQTAASALGGLPVQSPPSLCGPRRWPPAIRSRTSSLIAFFFPAHLRDHTLGLGMAVQALNLSSLSTLGPPPVPEGGVFCLTARTTGAWHSYKMKKGATGVRSRVGVFPPGPRALCRSGCGSRDLPAPARESTSFYNVGARDEGQCHLSS